MTIEPNSISISRPASGPDGYPGAVTETYTEEMLAQLIEPALRHALTVLGPQASAESLSKIVANQIAYPLD